MIKKNSKIKNLVKEHILKNKRQYAITFAILFIGIAIGVAYVNNFNNEKTQNTSEYIIEFVEKYKLIEKVNSGELFKISMVQNCVLGILIWFFGTTIIGLPVVFGLILYKGFSLGYTIAAITISLGTTKSICFVILSLLFQNIVLIPGIIAIAVSCIRLYSSIIKDRRTKNIKLEVIRHTIFSLAMFTLLILAAFLESFISSNILKMFIKYF